MLDGKQWILECKVFLPLWLPLCHFQMAEFILETSYPSRRIIRQTDNSSKYKSEDEFCSIICLDILSEKRPREKGNIAKI